MTGEPDKINPDDYQDPNNPPPGGYQAIDCPECAPTQSHLKSTAQRMAVGPIASTDLGAGTATSFCPRCRGRRWVWYRALDI
jgi:hypothetical protein